MRAARNGRLAEIVRAFRGRRVAVLADLVCDEFVHGDVARVSREAPVLILDHARTEITPGGGANAVWNLRALDAAPVPVGLVGRDDAGRRLVEFFRRAGIPTGGIEVRADYETPTKSRVLAGGIHTRRQQIVRIDRGARHGALSPERRARIAGRLDRAVRAAEGLLVADYGYGAATPALVRGVRRVLAGKPVTVDSRHRIAAFRRVAACTPNQEEVERALAGGPLSSDRAVAEAGRALLRATGNGAVLVTRGARGMLLVEQGCPPVAIPPFGSGEVADVTGAGDTVIAAFTLALLSGGSPAEAAVIANTAAGLVVMKYGTATVSRAELARALAEGPRA